MDSPQHANGTLAAPPAQPTPDHLDRFVPQQTYLRGTKLAAIVRQIVRDIGPEATFEHVLDVLWREHQGKCSQHLFTRCYNLVFPSAGEPARYEPTLPLSDQVDLPDLPDEPSPPIDTADFAAVSGRLSEFIRFAGAVSAVGGVANARRYLDALERIARSL